MFFTNSVMSWVQKSTDVALIILLLSGGLGGCQSGKSGATLMGEEEEQTLPQIKVTLPPSPSFERKQLVEKYADGSYSIHGLRAQRQLLLNKTVTLTAFLILHYECPKEKAKQGGCQKPHLLVADNANSSIEEAMMVTDIPKDLARDRLLKPILQVGNRLTVQGVFNTSAPSGWRNSEGLVVYEKIMEKQ